MTNAHQTSDLIEEIRLYTKQHPELAKAHHFIYDLPFNPALDGADCFVMGVNPGESKADWKSVAHPTEETRDHDFHRVNGRSPGSKKWYSIASELLPTERFIFAEMFFWSSHDSKEFRKRYGKFVSGNPHVDFCTRLNRELISRYNPRMIVCPGITSLEHAQILYGLQERDIVRNSRSHRLIVDCVDQKGRPWVFTKHWSGARLSKSERNQIVGHLKKVYAHA